MLCMTVFQSSTDICRRYIHYAELRRSDSVVFKCINISDVNIEKIFDILGIHVIHYGHSIKFRYYLDGILIYI